MKSTPLLAIAFLALAGCAQYAESPESVAPSAAVTPATDLESAHNALKNYLRRLSDGRYIEAAKNYGGATDILVDWNPDVPEDDLGALFRNGCTKNGLQCRDVLRFVSEEQLSPVDFKFIVELMGDDTEAFVLPGTAQSEFVFTVKKVSGRFLVQDLPPYVH